MNDDEFMEFLRNKVKERIENVEQPGMVERARKFTRL